MIAIASENYVSTSSVRVHAHLKSLVNGKAAPLPLADFGFNLIFFDAQQADSLKDDGARIFFPATSETQVDSVSSLRRNGFWYSPVVAVVHDYSGHQTYSAIKHGASSVLNMAIPVESQIARLRPGVARNSSAGSASTDLAEEIQPKKAPRPTSSDHLKGAGLTRAEAETLREMLCGHETVAVIARRFFCSERTMYRKIRALYNQLHVSSRFELRAMMAMNHRAS